MTDEVVKWNSLYIRTKMIGSRERDYKDTFSAETMNLLRIILLINKSFNADGKRAWETNGTGLMI